jgi:hypothetical protein
MFRFSNIRIIPTKKKLSQFWIRPLITWVCIFALLVFIHIKLFPYSEDDAYIHFRIAENLADHGLPYFNLSDQVMSTSAPSWTLLLAFIFKFISKDLQIISILNSLLTTAGAFTFTLLLRQICPGYVKQVFYWLFSVLYISVILRPSISLMETPYAILLLGLGLLSLMKDHPASFFFMGIAVFTRLELVVFIVGAFIYWMYYKLFSYEIKFSELPQFIKKYRLPTVSFWLLLGTSPFVIFDVHFWGTVIPNTTAAKQVVYSMSQFAAFVKIILSFFPGLPLSGDSYIFQAYFILFGISALFMIFILIYAIQSKKKADTNTAIRSFTIIVIGSSFAIICAYTMMRVYIFDWYVPLYIIPFILASFKIMLDARGRLFRWLFIGLFSIWTCSFLVNSSYITLSSLLSKPELYPGFDSGARVRKYIQVGTALYRQYPTARLLTSELGGLGYGFRGYILDGAGLVTPEALQFHPMKVPEERANGLIGAIPVKFIQQTNPEIVVSYDIFIESFSKSDLASRYVLIREPIFLEDDLLRKNYPEPWVGKNLNIFIRKDIYLANPFNFVSTSTK